MIASRRTSVAPPAPARCICTARKSRRSVLCRIAAKEDGVQLASDGADAMKSFTYYNTEEGVLDSVDDSILDARNMRKTKIVATIGPTSNTQENIIEMGDKGVNVCRLNMSHGDHSSHQAVVEKIKYYNDLDRGCLAILLDTKGPEVRSGDLSEPAVLIPGEEWIFTIKEGETGAGRRISVNYDGFCDDVSEGDVLLVDGGIMTFQINSITDTDVVCEVVDGGEMGSRRHLNIRGKSANLPAITERDWNDIAFGVEMNVDFYALSFVRDAECIYELQEYLRNKGSTAKVLAKIESADAVENLESILDAVDGAMVARGDLGAELPVQCVPFWQSAIVQGCRTRGKPVIVATNMLESMIQNPAPTRAEVSDISIAVREGTDAVMLSGETAYGAHPLKSMQTMSIVAKRTEYSMTKYQGQRRFGTEHALPIGWISRDPSQRVNETFAYHTTTMANTLSVPVLVFTSTGNMPALLSHYRPNGPIFAFTDSATIRRRMALYHAVTALPCDFSKPSKEIVTDALMELKLRGLLNSDDQILVVQSSAASVWGFECPNAIMLYNIP